MHVREIKVPALGGFKDVPVIEVHVKPGDAVQPEDSLVTLESDKATMDVPSPAAGTVRDLRVKVGDKVSEGSLVVVLEEQDGAARGNGAAPSGNGAVRAEPAAPARAGPTSPPARAATGGPDAATPAEAPEAGAPPGASRTLEVPIPALGGYRDVPVIEVHVKPGDLVAVDAPLVTLESEKATMDVPAPAAGRVREVRVRAGDKVSEGSVVAVLDAAAEARPARAPAPPARAPAPAPPRGAPPAPREPTDAPSTVARSTAVLSSAPTAERDAQAGVPHASPAIRRLARELGADLGRIEGSGPRGRIVKDDVQRFVKELVTRASTGRGAGVGLDLPPWPKVDFEKFGPVERRPLTRIQRISGPALARNWVTIPHVTQHDEADVTDLEAFRAELNREREADGAKVTLLAFVVKACVAALRAFPTVNASLDGDALVLKRYFHVGFAADTPSGLVVPVLRDADRKGLLEIAAELAALAAKARDGKLAPQDLQGGTFSISSLGGIGGTAFTPIINAPEVAILGVSRAATRPVWDGEAFRPRLVLPLSLSYDHRVVDGALAARFTSFVAKVLGDFRRAML